MASSGTINGSRSGYDPYLRINWNIDQTDIPGNRTRLRLQLYLMHPKPVYYSATKSGVLQGSSFSSTTNVSGTGNTLLRTQYIWVSHNSDGSKTQRLSASFNIAVTFEGSRLSTLGVSGNAALDPIPRGSTLSAFSFPSSFQTGTSNKINYTVKRHSSDYRHQLQLRDGSVTVAQWDNLNSSGSTSVTVSSSQANSILNRMSTTTSKTFTLRLATRRSSGGSWVGDVHTRTATASVHSSVKPTINKTSAVPVGNSWAVNKGLYVQGQTGVRAEFSSSASGGARVRSRNISIGSLSSGGSVVGSVFRHSQSRVTSTGNITITYKITDTRGRTTSSTRTVNFRAYTPPKVTSFTSDRASTTSSTVSVRSKGSIHGLGGQNTGTMRVTQKGVSGNVRSKSLSNTTPTFNDSFNRTVSTASSADFTITVTDSLGNSATATTTVGTAFMELSIRKGTGVGIGKVHERGSLDVDGQAHFRGNLVVEPTDARPSLELHSYDPNGHAYLEYFGSDNERKGYVGFYTPTNNIFQVKNEQGGNIDLRTEGSGKATVNGAPIMPDSGTFTGGAWVKLADGTAIVWKEDITVTYTSATRLDYRWNLPIHMLATPRPAVLATKNEYTGAGAIRDATMGGYANESGGRTTYVDILMMAGGGTTFNSGFSSGVRVMVIGRWK